MKLIIPVSITTDGLEILQTKTGYERGSRKCFVILNDKRKYLNKDDADKVGDGQMPIKLTTKFKS